MKAPATRWTFDSREVRPGMGFVALKGEKADGRDFIPAALERGAVEVIEGLEALQARARERRRALAAGPAKVVAVTGSAGKTTTKELLKAFLSLEGKTYATEGNFNNHIGLPLTILNCPADVDFLVLEMGSNHPGEIAALCDVADPDIGVVTGIGTAHLEFFGTREGIADEKGTLIARANDFAVYPEDDDFAERLSLLNVAAHGIPPSVDGLLDPARAWPPRFASNAALAFAVAWRFGVRVPQARRALEGFALPGARWRLREKWGATFIDDTYNANPDSMLAALDTLAATPCDGKRVAVLGDMLELGPESEALHRRVFARAMELKIPLVIGVGELSSRCLCHRVYKDLKPLKRKFRLDVSAGDLVLLKASHAMRLGTLLDDD